MPTSTSEEMRGGDGGETIESVKARERSGPVLRVAGPNAPSIVTNVLIKKTLPPRGVVSSNPKLVQRLLDTAQQEKMLTNVTVHTDNGWGVIIYTAEHLNKPLFIASVPMGAAGSGVAFFEMFAAGAHAIIRYGSNDRDVGMENLRDIIVVDKADNVIGMRADACSLEVDGSSRAIGASLKLVAALETGAKQIGRPVKPMVCHNVEDYHAFNFPQFFYQPTTASITARIADLEAADGDRMHCWDMETGALFLRAQQFGRHAATVLQSLIKRPGMSPYEGEHGKISLEMEREFYKLVLDALDGVDC